MKVLTVTPAFVNDERMDIYYHYGDLQLVMNNAEVGNNGPYGIIWLIDSDACGFQIVWLFLECRKKRSTTLCRIFKLLSQTKA